jgi:hypothetical protein
VCSECGAASGGCCAQGNRGASAGQVGGIPNDELNGLEMELLFLLNFSLHTTRAEYDDYVAALGRRQVWRARQGASS